MKNSQVVPCSAGAGPWLAQAPRGAYTTVRTVGGDSVFELTFHIERLASTAKLMMDADCQEGKPHARELAAEHAWLCDAAALRPHALRALGAAAATYRAATGDARSELKLTALLTWGPDPGCPPDIYAHVSALPGRPPPPIKVVVRGAPRENAEAKDSEWVRQRAALEAAKPPDANEVLLASEEGCVYEGMTSNFFALLDGALYTAGEGVLLGSVRHVVLRVAAAQGVPVVLAPPPLARLDEWEAAMISSTSRLLLPVDELAAPEQSPPLVRSFARGGKAAALEAGVLAEVARRSEPLLVALPAGA